MVWIELYKRENGVDNNRISTSHPCYLRNLIYLKLYLYLLLIIYLFRCLVLHLEKLIWKIRVLKSENSWSKTIYLGMKLRKKNNVNVDVFTCILLNYIWHIANYYKINFNSFFIYMTENKIVILVFSFLL